jgi:hypothetical protein
MVKAWEVPSYRCPVCGADDSTYPCEFRVTSDVYSSYPLQRETEAREAGCRQIYYHDLHVKDQENG